jgi:hypothetical protein
VSNFVTPTGNFFTPAGKVLESGGGGGTDPLDSGKPGTQPCHPLDSGCRRLSQSASPGVKPLQFGLSFPSRAVQKAKCLVGPGHPALETLEFESRGLGCLRRHFTLPGGGHDMARGASMICLGIGGSPPGRLDHGRTGTVRVGRDDPGSRDQIALDGDCSNLGMNGDQVDTGGPGTDKGDVPEQGCRQSRIHRRTEAIDESVAIDICGCNPRRNGAATERGDE